MEIGGLTDDTPWRQEDFNPNAAADAAYPEGITRYEIVPPSSPVTPEDAAALVRTINSIGVSHPHLRIASPALYAKLIAHAVRVA